MKKLLFSAFMLLLCAAFYGQSATFGLTAGYMNINVNVKTNYGASNIKISDDASGFYVGGLVDIAAGGNFHVQPEALFALAEDSKLLYIPILAKLYIADSGFHLMAGPQANISLEEGTPEVNSFGFDATFGAGYDIDEHFFFDARYGIELTNRSNDDSIDFKAHANTLNIGLGYKF